MPDIERHDTLALLGQWEVDLLGVPSIPSRLVLVPLRMTSVVDHLLWVASRLAAGTHDVPRTLPQ